MKKVIKFLTLSLAVLFLSCTSEETTCTQKVYKKDGAEWVLINSGSWKGESQYKNYVKTIKNADGTFTSIKTIVTCD